LRKRRCFTQDEGKRDDSTNELVASLTSDRKLTSARDAQNVVPASPGLYAIFVDGARSLPALFHAYLLARQTRLIYVGRGDNLRRRWVGDDLRHTGPSTFFRGMGAALGFTPPRGSLSGRRNQHNYRFGDQDTKDIIDWMDAHLFVRWQTLGTDALQVWESRAVRAYHPLFDTSGNPEALQELADLRKHCRDIARAID
jgi:hypothetical protein